MESGILNEVENQKINLPWDKFFEWVHCIGVVTFDLELGQALEFSYPLTVTLSDKERSNICYLSFPDSNSGCMGDTQYSFRIRSSHYNVNSPSALKCIKNCPVTLLKESAHFHGFVYFRQVRDKTLRRGYFQKSVVMITRLPYFTFFKEIVDLIAPEYFDHGETCLETACHDIDQWPAPEPGMILDLPLLGMVLRVRVPLKQDKPGISILDSTDIAKPAMVPQYILSSINELDIIKSFQPVLTHCNLLWELVLLGEPMVVMASSPETCSSMVLALSLSICPLKYNCDYRPFFTIHDSEFKEYTSRTQAPPKVILGVTNPFFTKTLQHWPHIIRIGDVGLPSSVSTGSLLAGDKLKKNSKIKSFDAKPGLYTEYKVCLKKDKSFLKSLTKPGHRLTNADSVKLRRYFLELTQSFMIPLERYMATLMPLQKNISPLRAPPVLKSFKPEEFLSTVDSQGPHLTSHTKGDWGNLYKRFFNSPNFVHWLDGRKVEMQNKIEALHIIGIGNTNIADWCSDKSEVEIVDMVLRLRTKLKTVKTRDLNVPKETANQIEKQLIDIIGSLPEDLRLVLK